MSQKFFKKIPSKLSYSIIFVIFFSVALWLASFLFIKEIQPQPVNAAGWLSGWSYRKPITVDNTQFTAVLSNYQTKIKIPYESSMKSDFSDLRFTDSDGTTLLNYWLEQTVDNDEIAASDVVPSPVYTQSRTPNSGQAAYAFDLSGDIWYIAQNVTSWVQIDFGKLVYIDQLRVKGGSSASGASFAVKVSADGTNWTTLLTYTGDTYRGVTPTPWLDVKTQIRYIRHEHTNSTGYHDFSYCGVKLGSGQLVATTWVKVPSIPASSTKNIYMYYGNSSATLASNGFNTFDFFDDFNDNSFNTSKWTITENTGNAGTVAEVNQRLELTQKEIQRSLSVDGSAFSVALGSNQGIMLEFWLNTRVTSGGWIQEPNAYLLNSAGSIWTDLFYQGYTGNVGLRDSSSSSSSLGTTNKGSTSINVSCQLKIDSDDYYGRWTEFSGPSTLHDFSGTAASSIFSGVTSAKVRLKLYQGGSSEGTAQKIAFDDVRVRKYIYPEPKTLRGVEETSCTANGGLCSASSSCCSNYCRADYSGGASYCAQDSTSCVHSGTQSGTQYTNGSYAPDCKTAGSPTQTGERWKCSSGSWVGESCTGMSNINSCQYYYYTCSAGSPASCSQKTQTCGANQATKGATSCSAVTNLNYCTFSDVNRNNCQWDRRYYGCAGSGTTCETTVRQNITTTCSYGKATKGATSCSAVTTSNYCNFGCDGACRIGYYSCAGSGSTCGTTPDIRTNCSAGTACAGGSCSASNFCNSSWKSGSCLGDNCYNNGGTIYLCQGTCDGSNNCDYATNCKTMCTDHSVSGWAWSENVGWVSFSCKNCDTDGNGYIDSGACGGDNTSTFMYNYGVDINYSNGALSGYAWSPVVGWISFNSADTAGCPSGTCAPTLTISNKQISGYGRVLAYTGTDWGGWLRLRDTNYGVYIDAPTGEFRNWAWAPEQIGWLSFNCKNCQGTTCGSTYATCGDSTHPNYHVITEIYKPSVEIISGGSVDDSCIYCKNGNYTFRVLNDGTYGYFTGSTFNTDSKDGMLTFSWKYIDSNGLKLKNYQFKVNNVNNVDDPAPEVNLTVSRTALPNEIVSQPVGVKVTPGSNELAYNTTYYWWVKACNEFDACSDWKYGGSFTTPTKHFPIVRVAWDQAVISTGETVQLCASANVSDSSDPCYSVCWKGTGSPVVDPNNQYWKCSVCYNSSNQPVPCQQVSASYQWYMPDGFALNTDYNYADSTTSTSANPRVQFLTVGKNKEIKLSITDSGYDCGGKVGGNIELPIPNWKEISPF